MMGCCMRRSRGVRGHCFDPVRVVSAMIGVVLTIRRKLKYRWEEQTIDCPSAPLLIKSNSTPLKVQTYNWCVQTYSFQDVCQPSMTDDPQNGFPSKKESSETSSLLQHSLTRNEQTVFHHAWSLLRSVPSHLHKELYMTCVLLADNALICLLPTTLFAVAAALRSGLPFLMLARGLGSALVLGLLFAYIFEACNQIQGVKEDSANKPYRPIPAGLTDRRGLTWRFLLVMPLYSLIGWWCGVLHWVLLWQACVMLQHFCSTPGAYIFWKTPFNASGSFTQLATGWSVVAPLDRTAWTWILVISIYMPLPLIYEDVRDMKGDSMIGRRTPALVFGHQPIRWWFAAFMLALPGVVFGMLVKPSGAPLWRQILGTGLIAVFAWTCMVRALALRDTVADRVTYQMFTLLWGLVLGLGVFLWWP